MTMKRLLIILSFLSISVGTFALPTDQPQSFWTDPLKHPMLPLFVVIGFIVVIAVLLVLVMIYMIKVLSILGLEWEKQRAEKLGVEYKPRPSLWSRFSQKINASVPLEKEKDIELDHNYDGIRELDNHLPPWWKWLFYSTIGWSFVYLIAFHVVDYLPLSIGEYDREVAIAEEQVRKLKASQPVAEVDVNTLVFSKDSTALIDHGKKVFADNNCGSCHGVDGGGNTIGPNLTDVYWLHGGGVKQVFATVKDGVVDKGMPAWGRTLKPQEVRDVTYFILSLQGTTPNNPKAPQGEIFKEVIAPTDSTNAQASL
jgi:cytochrome c oxidase cbb3-type subunit 3